MNINYLKKLEAYPGNRTFKRRGLSIARIQELEAKYNDGKPFPESIREFLFLAGEMPALGIDIGSSWEWMQEDAKEVLAHYEVKIERPFFVLYQLDNCAIFTFFYLDDERDNPQLHHCYADYKFDNTVDEFIESSSGGFVEVVEGLVEMAIIDSKYI